MYCKLDVSKYNNVSKYMYINTMQILFTWVIYWIVKNPKRHKFIDFFFSISRLVAETTTGCFIGGSSLGRKGIAVL